MFVPLVYKIGPVTYERRIAAVTSSSTNETNPAQPQGFENSSGGSQQLTNTQISVRGNNANDTNGGTGVNGLIVTYYDQDWNGPFTETINLAGLTPVASVGTNFCFIDNIQVTTVGAASPAGFNGDANATYTGPHLFITSVVLSSINFIGYPTHWVPAGKTCYITGMGISRGQLTTGGATLVLKMTPLGFCGLAFLQPDTVTFNLLNKLHAATGFGNIKFKTPIAIQGPAKIFQTVIPGNATVGNSYSSYYEFYEITTPG